MSACAMQTFNNVTDQVWACCKAEVKKLGFDITADGGNGSSHGFDVTWNYDRAAATLQIQVVNRPEPHFLYTCSAVNGRIHDAVSACYAKHDTAPAAMI